MCAKSNLNRYERPAAKGRNEAGQPQSHRAAPCGLQGFFSFDSCAAVVMAIVAFSAFAALSSAAALHAKAEANEVSGRLLSLRLSSFLLEQGAVSSGDSYGGGYFSANELDLEKLRSLDLRPLLLQIGKSHLKVSLDVGGGEIFSAEAGEGASAQPEAFCTARLALISGKISRLEACVS